MATGGENSILMCLALPFPLRAGSTRAGRLGLFARQAAVARRQECWAGFFPSPPTTTTTCKLDPSSPLHICTRLLGVGQSCWLLGRALQS